MLIPEPCICRHPCASGADPVKLQRQIALYGTSVDGMPALWVYRGSDWRAHDIRWRDQSHADRHAVTWHACARRSHWGPHVPLWSFAHCWSTITMIPPVRQEILRVLADLSACCPDVRFGQLLANLSYLAKGPTNEAIGDGRRGATRGSSAASGHTTPAPYISVIIDSVFGASGSYGVRGIGVRQKCTITAYWVVHAGNCSGCSLLGHQG